MVKIAKPRIQSCLLVMWIIFPFSAFKMTRHKDIPLALLLSLAAATINGMRWASVYNISISPDKKMYYGNKSKQMPFYMRVYICIATDIIYRDTDKDIDISWDSHFPLQIFNWRFNLNYQSIEIIQRATAQPWFPNNKVDTQTLKVYTIKDDIFIYFFSVSRPLAMESKMGE